MNIFIEESLKYQGFYLINLSLIAVTASSLPEEVIATYRKPKEHCLNDLEKKNMENWMVPKVWEQEEGYSARSKPSQLFHLTAL